MNVSQPEYLRVKMVTVEMAGEDIKLLVLRNRRNISLIVIEEKRVVF